MYKSYRVFRIRSMSARYLHSEKFKMDEEVGSLLSEKVSNLLLTLKANSIYAF